MKIQNETGGKPISKVAMICKLLSLLCLGATILLAVWGIILFGVMCFSLFTGPYNSDGLIVAFVYPVAFLMYMLTSSLIPFILWRMLGEISEARTPFVLKNANRLRNIAFLFLLYDVLALLMDLFSSQFLLQAHGLSIFIGDVISDYASNSTATLDLFPLVIAAVFFALSYVFKYGVLLQQESDETL